MTLTRVDGFEWRWVVGGEVVGWCISTNLLLPATPQPLFCVCVFFRLQLLCTVLCVYNFDQMCVRRRLYTGISGWEASPGFILGEVEFTAVLYGRDDEEEEVAVAVAVAIPPTFMWKGGQHSHPTHTHWQTTTRCVCNFGAFVRVQRWMAAKMVAMKKDPKEQMEWAGGGGVLARRNGFRGSVGLGDSTVTECNLIYFAKAFSKPGG